MLMMPPSLLLLMPPSLLLMMLPPSLLLSLNDAPYEFLNDLHCLRASSIVFALNALSTPLYVFPVGCPHSFLTAERPLFGLPRGLALGLTASIPPPIARGGSGKPNARPWPHHNHGIRSATSTSHSAPVL